MRQVRRMLVVVGATVLTLGIGATTAEAAPPAGSACSGDDNRVNSCFTHNGDVFWVKDTEKDGRSAVARWQTRDGRTGYCRNAKGFGTWQQCNYDFKEMHGGRSNVVSWENWTYDAETKDWNYVSGTYSAYVNGKLVIEV
jgi:hypothetical protein